MSSETNTKAKEPVEVTTTDSTKLVKALKKESISANKAKALYLKKKAEANKPLMAQQKKHVADNAKAKKEAQAKRKPKGKQVKLVALTNLSAKYKLPYSEGQFFTANEAQAKELIGNKDAEKTK